MATSITIIGNVEFNKIVSYATEIQCFLFEPQASVVRMEKVSNLGRIEVFRLYLEDIECGSATFANLLL